MVDIMELYYGVYVKVGDGLFFVSGTDYEKNTVSVVPIELLDRYSQTEIQLDAHSVPVSIRDIEIIPPVQVDEAVLRKFFRLEITPWELAAENKYPFSISTDKYRFTEDDMLCFLENLKELKNDTINWAWMGSFGGRGERNFAIWPEQTEPGFSFSFLCDHVWDLMGWVDITRDCYEDWKYIYELRDCYLESKNRPISETIISDEFKGDLLSDIERYAEKHEINDDVRAYYVKLLDEVAVVDGEDGLIRKAYAYYGGNGIVPCDWKKSEMALLQAFEIAGDPYVANSLGYIYYSDRLGEPDYKKAFYYFDYAAGDGVIEATYKLSDMYRKGHGAEKNPAKAWNLLMDAFRWTNKKQKAKGKYPDIMLRMGYCYRDGIGVQKDFSKALECFYEAKQGIELRIKKDKGFGDEQVLKNVLRAIESIETSKQSRVPVSYIRLLFDYPCYPVWLYADDGCVIDTDLPEEWQDDKELDALFLRLQEAYIALFVDDEKEFSYIGFTSDEGRSNFENLMTEAVNALYQKNNGKYRIVNDLAV